MRALMRLVLGIVLLVGLLVAVAYALPQQVSVARTKVINAPEADIFPYVNNLRNFNKWSPWAARDPNIAYDFSGPESGVGARMSWTSDKLGNGSQEIIESRPNSYVKISMELDQMGAAIASYTLSPSGAGTQVKWGFDTDVGNDPLMRWVGLLYDHWVGKDYEDGLERLRKLVETGGA